MPEDVQLPYCLAMLLCDRAERDAATGKYTLVGTFSRLEGKRLPLRARFCVYFAVTDGDGTVPLRLKFIDSAALVEARDPVAQIDAELHLENPLVVVEGVVHVDMEFDSAGVYYCELLSGEQLLLSRRLFVEVAEHADEAK